MMSELADRLEALKNRATEHIAKDEYQTAQILNFEMATMVWQQCEAIIKALRFAADMETLVQAGCEPGLETQVDNPDNPDDPERCVVRWWNGRHWQFSYGVDYYTAARRAVEELEKGESDGK